MFINGRLNQHFFHLNSLKNCKEENEDGQHLSDIEDRTDPDRKVSKAYQEELRQLLSVCHAFETFHDYQEIKQSMKCMSESKKKSTWLLSEHSAM